jgi:hypothetical protein
MNPYIQEFQLPSRMHQPIRCANPGCTARELVRVPGECCHGCLDQQEKERQRLRILKAARL